MTVINQIGVNSPGVNGHFPPAFAALAQHPDLGAWFDVDDTQNLLGGAYWYEKAKSRTRKFRLINTEVRPRVRVYDEGIFLGALENLLDPYPIIVSDEGVLPLTGNWSISGVTDGFGTVPVCPIVGTVGDNGGILRVVSRSGSFIEVTFEENNFYTGMRSPELAAGKHTFTLAYNRATNFGYLYVDGAFVGSHEMTGFNQTRTDIAFLCDWDAVLETSRGSRGAYASDIMVSMTNAHINQGIMTTYNAAMLAKYPDLPL